MAWIVERLGLRGSLAGTWVAISQRNEHEFALGGMKGVIPVQSLRTVASPGFDAALFLKYGPLIVDVGLSPSWSKSHNAIQYRGLFGVVIPVGKNCEFRISGGYRKFTTSTTNSNPVVRESAGPAIQIDLAALLGEKGALVMTTRGSIADSDEDIQPMIALGGEWLLAGRHVMVRDHTEAELALDRAHQAVKAARALLSEGRIRSEIDWFASHEGNLRASFHAVERAVNSLLVPNYTRSHLNVDSFADLKDRAYAAAKYAAEYAVSDTTKEASQLLLKQIRGLPLELKLKLAHFVAADTFDIIGGIKQEGGRLMKWILLQGDYHQKEAQEKLDRYAAILGRFQSLIGNLSDGNIELLNILADTSHTIRCLQGKAVSCDPALSSISHDRITRIFAAMIEGTE